MPNEKKVLLVLDFINEIIHPDGKLSGKGYSAFEKQHSTLDKAVTLLEKSRNRGDIIIHIRVGFLPGYPEHPLVSPLFGAAKEYGALQLGTWGTEFHDKVKPIGDEDVIVKNRVSAFFGTSLDIMLKHTGTNKIGIMGVATDMAVQATARDAHDRDLQVEIIADCCAAADQEDHDQTLRMLSKVASVISSGEF
ncbi:MAG: cysteine hydrolase [Rhodospirillales bacterium]|nr:cysteine hydrolase [Rhodospirillales bacterium]